LFARRLRIWARELAAGEILIVSSYVVLPFPPIFKLKHPYPSRKSFVEKAVRAVPRSSKNTTVQ
jgi:hypothetical protein